MPTAGCRSRNNVRNVLHMYTAFRFLAEKKLLMTVSLLACISLFLNLQLFRQLQQTSARLRDANNALWETSQDYAAAQRAYGDLQANMPALDRERRERIWSETIQSWKQFPLTRKQYGTQTIVAYRMRGFVDGDFPLFLLHAVGSKYNTEIVSNAALDSYSTEELFDIVDSTLYVINAKQKTLEEYSVQQVNGIVGIQYLASYRLPAYKIGTVHRVSCRKDICTVGTAFHLEAGCETAFSLRSKTFTKPNCGNHIGLEVPLEKE